MNRSQHDLDELLGAWREASGAPINEAARTRIRAAVVEAARIRAAQAWWGRLLGVRTLAPLAAGAAALVLAAGWSAPASSPLHGIRLLRESVILTLPGDHPAEALGFAEDRLAQAPHDGAAAALDLGEASGLLDYAQRSIAQGSPLYQRLRDDRALLFAEAKQLRVCPGREWCSSLQPNPVPIVSPAATPTAKPTAAPTSRPTPPPKASPSPSPSPTLFSDSFDQDAVGSAPAGWTPQSGSWSVQLDGTNHVLHNAGSGISRITAGSPRWSNVTVSAALRIDPGGSTAGVLARWQDPNNYYVCKLFNNTLTIGKQVAGSFQSIATKPYIASGWQTVSLTVKGTSLTCKVGAVSVSATDATFAAGEIGILGGGAMDADSVAVVSS